MCDEDMAGVSACFYRYTRRGREQNLEPSTLEVGTSRMRTFRKEVASVNGSRTLLLSCSHLYCLPSLVWVLDGLWRKEGKYRDLDHSSVFPRSNAVSSPFVSRVNKVLLILFLVLFCSTFLQYSPSPILKPILQSVPMFSPPRLAFFSLSELQSPIRMPLGSGSREHKQLHQLGCSCYLTLVRRIVLAHTRGVNAASFTALLSLITRQQRSPKTSSTPKGRKPWLLPAHVSHAAYLVSADC